ncbi:hypothetical protein MOSE0_G00518 [Monosporozyma servazzii]
MKLYSLLGSVLITTTCFSNAQTVCNSNNIINKCPEWNFDHHQEMLNVYPRYHMEMKNIQYAAAETYDVTIRVYANENIALKYLHSLKIIGVQGPQGTIQLWGANEGVTPQDFVPSDFTSTFKIHANANGNPCNVELPSFQIQYEYDYSDEWAANRWGQTHFDLMVGCGGDNQGNSNFDFPAYVWPKDCDSNCGGDSSSSYFPISTSTFTSEPIIYAPATTAISVPTVTTFSLPQGIIETDLRNSRSKIPFPLPTTKLVSQESSSTLPVEIITSVPNWANTTSTQMTTPVVSSKNVGADLSKIDTNSLLENNKSSTSKLTSKNSHDTNKVQETDNTVVTGNITAKSQQFVNTIPAQTSITASTEIITINSLEITTSTLLESSTDSPFQPISSSQKSAPFVTLINNTSSQPETLPPQMTVTSVLSESTTPVPAEFSTTKSYISRLDTTVLVPSEATTMISPETTTIFPVGDTKSAFNGSTTIIPPEPASTTSLDNLNTVGANTAVTAQFENNTTHSQETLNTRQLENVEASSHGTPTAISTYNIIPRFSESTTIIPTEVNLSDPPEIVSDSTDTSTLGPIEKTKYVPTKNSNNVPTQASTSLTISTTVIGPKEIISSVSLEAVISNTKEKRTSAPNTTADAALTNTDDASQAEINPTGTTNTTRSENTGAYSQEVAKTSLTENVHSSPSENATASLPPCIPESTASSRVKNTVDVNVGFEGGASNTKGSMVMIMLSLLLIF